MVWILTQMEMAMLKLVRRRILLQQNHLLLPMDQLPRNQHPQTHMLLLGIHLMLSDPHIHPDHIPEKRQIVKRIKKGAEIKRGEKTEIRIGRERKTKIRAGIGTMTGTTKNDMKRTIAENTIVDLIAIVMNVNIAKVVPHWIQVRFHVIHHHLDHVEDHRHMIDNHVWNYIIR
jgi:hypothetical protein